MRKTISLGLVLLIFASVFVGCKKGENDPFMSLLSRKARLTGVWNLTSADYDYTTVNGSNTTVYGYSYDGTQMTRTVDGTGTTYDYSEEITIEKDGTFKVVTKEEEDYWDDVAQEMKTGTNTETVSGLWYFVDGNKELDVKNKERVEFLMTDYKEVDPDGDTYECEYSGKSNPNVMIMLLDRLANKEITMLYDEEYSVGGDGNTKSGTMDYIRE